jgi:hydrogenase-4 component F
MVSSVFSCAQIFVVFRVIQPLLFGDIPNLIFAPGLNLDRIGACFVLLITVVMACCVTHAVYFFQGEGQPESAAGTWHLRIFFACIHLFLLAMTFVFICDNLGYLWIGIEATTLSSAPLVYFDRTKNALEASWKYLIICSVGIAFALLGTVFIFASSQHGVGADEVHSGTLSISDLIARATSLNFPLLKLGFIFCLVGYGTKAGIFPLHSWLPDAYSEAPAPASAMLSAILCNCALFGIWRVMQIAQATKTHAPMFELAATLGTITVVAASLMLVRQHSLKRLWAYSTIENIGIMLVAIGLGSGGLFVLQAINHSLGKAAVFLISGNLIQSTGRKNLSNLHGILKTSPVCGALLVLASLAVTGSPPFGSFISELAIVVTSADASHWILSIFLVVGMAVSFVAVASHVGAILFGSAKPGTSSRQPLYASLMPALLLCCALALGSVVRTDFWIGLQ